MSTFAEPEDARQCWHTDCVSLAVGRGLCARHHTYYAKHEWPMPKEPRKRHRLSNLDVENKEATCEICGPNTEIKPHAGKSLGWVCHKTRVRTLQDKLRRRVAPYGITVEYFLELMRNQDQGCAICSTKFFPAFSEVHAKNIHIDHDHLSGKVRGVLCHKCNVGLGHFEDSASLLRLAASYLEKNNVTLS